ncbi:MAG: rhodanese-like domain-containing protein [Jatrophihabitantaceae bacterium]
MSEFEIPTVTLDELPADARILDVREQFEWNEGHIAGAQHVPMNSVPNRVSYEPDLIERDERVYVICAMGARSGQVTAWLVHNGYDAVNVGGGMNAWQDAGRPIVRDLPG